MGLFKSACKAGCRKNIEVNGLTPVKTCRIFHLSQQDAVTKQHFPARMAGLSTRKCAMGTSFPSPDFWATARESLPSHFGITAIPRLLPDVIAPGTVHNALSAGVGPVHRKVNGRVILERDSFLEWLQGRPCVSRRNKA